jgi:hypothetical protein
VVRCDCIVAGNLLNIEGAKKETREDSCVFELFSLKEAKNENLENKEARRLLRGGLLLKFY